MRKSGGGKGSAGICGPPGLGPPGGGKGGNGMPRPGIGAVYGVRFLWGGGWVKKEGGGEVTRDEAGGSAVWTAWEAEGGRWEAAWF